MHELSLSTEHAWASVEPEHANLSHLSGISECGTWSHAVISSLGVSQRGGSGACVPCRTLSDRDSGQSPVMPHHDGFWHW